MSPGACLRSSRSEAATGEVRERGRAGTTFLMTPDGSRALVGGNDGLHAFEPFGDGAWELDGAVPVRVVLAAGRAAWTDGRRVVLADLP